MANATSNAEMAVAAYERALGLWRGGTPEGALREVQQAIRLLPEEPAFHNLAGALQAVLGAAATARNSFRAALGLAPGDPAIWSNLATSAREGGLIDAALTAGGRVLALAPENAEALAARAILRHQHGEIAAAARLYRRVIALLPFVVDPWCNLGAIRRDAGAVHEAITALRRGLAVDPGHADARMNLGVALCDVLDWTPAIAALTAAAQGPSPSALVLSNLGSALFRHDRLQEAGQALRRALARDPGHAPSHSNLSLVEQAWFEHPAAARSLRRALAIDWQAPTHSNLLMQLCYDPATTNEALFEEARRGGAVQGPAAASHAPPQAPGPDRPLRVGWLSADFLEHPVARNVVGILEHRDRARFAAVGYANVRSPDGMTARLRGLMDQWRDVVGLDDEALAERIRADRIDILIVLAGHTGHNRLGVAVRRPAPVQVSFHDLTTSGLASVDAWITDSVLHPDDTRERFTERLIRLPCFYLHTPIDEAPAIPPPAAGPLTFGSFNNTSKLSPELLGLWGRILVAVPGSQLSIKYHGRFAESGLQDRVRRILADCGVAADRIVFHSGRSTRSDHLALLSGTDVALDTFPFNGSTTTFEALWMGVPVVTLAGERFLSRVGASVLAQVGLTDLVARTPEDYVSIAVRLAGDAERRRLLRGTLRGRLSSSPLCQPETYTRSFEAALRGLSSDACR